ncbi:MAG TPA: MmcQ/YjbR family DNA-binding protein [Flavobacterium sp.]|uniref:MmcQ/YjbR family DNA-binding protein n=1 Tax=Flavobacterium sp. TaxID=239 RepID=UPI002ECFC4B7
MDIETFRSFCLSLPDTHEQMPFKGFFRESRSILVFYIGKKMFCLFDIDRFDACTIKCDSDKISELKDQYTAVGPPFNLSPKYWISVKFNDDLPDPELFKLIEESYALVKKSLPKKV